MSNFVIRYLAFTIFLFLGLGIDAVQATETRKVGFLVEGERVVGDLYLPENFNPETQYPSAVVTGSVTSVKEQNSGVYARELAERGYIALAFDHRYWGASEGYPRALEDPFSKVEDIKAAVDFLVSTEGVNPSQIYGVGVCAGSGYMAVATAEDERIQSTAFVAGAFTSPQVFESIFGAEGFESAKEEAETRVKSFEETGIVDYRLAVDRNDIESGAIPDPLAIDYYLKRARTAGWQNRMAKMSMAYMFQFDSMAAARSIATPALVIHSDGAVSSQTARNFHDALGGEKSLVWLGTTNHFNFYDDDSTVDASVNAIDEFFVSAKN